MFNMLVIVNYCLFCLLVLLMGVLILVIGVNGSGKFNFYWVLCLFVDIV